MLLFDVREGGWFGNGGGICYFKSMGWNIFI